MIGLDGEVYKGRDEGVAGAHCAGYNASSVGVCYVGGCGKDMKAKDTRTPGQREALRQLVGHLRSRYPQAWVCGHNRLTCTLPKRQAGFDVRSCRKDCTQCCYAAKACPSFNVEAEFPD